MIDRLIEALRGLDPQPTAGELADALWLARYLPARQSGRPDAAADGQAPPAFDGREKEPFPEPPDTPPNPPDRPVQVRSAAAQAGLHMAPPRSSGSQVVRSPAMPAIPRALRLARALRPLRVGAASRTRAYLDEEATAQQIAETGVWRPELRPEPERWLDVALVIDDSVSMTVWQRTVSEFQAVLERLAAFRDVRVWRIDTDSDRLTLRAHASRTGPGRNPNELIDPTRRRVVLVISDCVGRAWRDGQAAALLERWGRMGPVAIVQPLPQRLWWRCAAALEPVSIRASQPAQPNERLDVRSREAAEPPPGIAIPVLELEPRWLRPWAELVGGGASRLNGMALMTGRPVSEDLPENGQDELSPLERVMRFRASASPPAFQLAVYLAAAPLRPPVMRLVQRAMLPDSRPAHLAEVFLSGLLRKVDVPEDPEQAEYEFLDGVRDVLLGALGRGEAVRVLREVWEVIRIRWGSVLDFPALLRAMEQGSGALSVDPPFARVTAQVLARLGGRYTAIAERLTADRGPGASLPSDDVEEDEAAAGPPASRTRPPRAAEPVIRGGLPPRNPDFTGRDELLPEIRRRLDDGVTVLTPQADSLGGEGKSQLAAEFAHRHAADYDLIWWIPTEQVTLARSSLAELARRLGTPLSDDINRTVDRVLRELRRGSRYRRWLLVYDNAADPDELTPLMPVDFVEGRLVTLRQDGVGHVLVTSGDRRWAERATALRVGVFERPESIAFLRRRVPRLSVTEADRLAARVGDLPLAVEQAAALLAETGRGVEEHLRSLEEQLGQKWILDLPPEYPVPLAATLGVNFERLRQDAPATARLLELWAFFGPEPVVRELLSAGGRARLPAALQATLTDPERLTWSMRDIGRHALGRYDRQTASLQVHRLVRTMLQAKLSGPKGARIRGQVHRVLAAAMPERPPEDETTWARRAQITPHVVPAGVIDGATTQIREVALDQVRYLYLLGDFEGARTLGQAALERWTDILGPDDRLVLRTCHNMGNVLRALGKVADARRLNSQTLDRAMERFGPNDRETLLVANSVGADLRLQGDFTRALELDQRTMGRMVRMFGRDNRTTLMVANNVSIDLRLLGRFREAHEIDRDALDRMRRLGRHRNTLLAMNQVARDLHGLGRYREAEILQQQALEVMRETLGPDHTVVLQAQMSHVGTLRKLGPHEQARELAETTLQLHLQRFGPEHPDTLAAQRSLAVACAVTGDAERGRTLSEEARRGYHRLLGADHPFVHACGTDLALSLRALGSHDAALLVDDSSLHALQRRLGVDHYYSLCCSVGLVHDLFFTGRLEAALSRSKDTLARFRAHHGPDHVYSLVCAHNHRVIAERLGREPSQPDPLPDLTRALGADHPDVRRAGAGELVECDIEPIPL
ncbi:Tetratricopeptide repeat-containing protein [Thermomonospora echinospora]|uniref:Tetratricopeptide repeat-containing protein n=1 Tax=Thermomonospora echinospora TaxID=1992 RepID=A0A1H5XX77_9ACTN|nr:FxSxx-COOH system tetratricopeptide repeat protein [Thermomonospora echinospora]SEG16301.1 Tetratricopeptide repeat-containing protein [Thermomonospora echinospora]